MPLWVSFVGYWVNGEQVLGLEYAAMGLCFLGLVAIALSKHNAELTSGQSTLVLGVILTFL